MQKINSTVTKNSKIFESEQDRKDYIRILTNQFTTTQTLSSKERDKLVEAIMSSQDKGLDTYAFDMNNQETRIQVKQHAANIMRQNKCDVYTALACAIRDCNPDQCDIPPNAKEHVEDHFSPEDIEEVNQLAQQVTEWFKGCEDEEVVKDEKPVKDKPKKKTKTNKKQKVEQEEEEVVKSEEDEEETNIAESITQKQKDRLLKYATRDYKRSGGDPREILADLLENVANLENAKVEDHFTDKQIQSIVS